jgi:hypothetical protein
MVLHATRRASNDTLYVTPTIIGQVTFQVCLSLEYLVAVVRTTMSHVTCFQISFDEALLPSEDLARLRPLGGRKRSVT